MNQAKVTLIESLGEGTRVCLDFVDVLEENEGVLVGNTGHGYTLLLAECWPSETYPPRPFRVNAGAIHHYLLLNEDKTCYLSGIKPGMKVAVWRADGSCRLVAVGRVKVEKRQLVRIAFDLNGREISVTVQDSDSVRFLSDDKEIQVSNLKVGDEVSAWEDKPGRHIGERIEEYISEV
jgi:3-dehydroquinate synthase II